MRTIFTITFRTLKQNKKKTFLTILTVALSVAMTFSILCGMWSMLSFLQTKEKIFGGDFEYRMECLSQQQAQELVAAENVKSVSLLRFVGNSFYGERSNRTLLSVAGINQAFVNRFYLEQYLQSGRFPTNENEIVISQSFIEKNGLALSVGDTITLSLGKRVWDEIDTELYGLVNYMEERENFHPEVEKTFLITGFLSDIDGSKIAGNFNAFTGIGSEADDLSAYVTCHDISKSIYHEAEKNATDFGGQNLSFHTELLLFYGVTAGRGTVKILLAVFVLLFLLLSASAAMIRNILSISLQERIKQLGMLSSIGATKNQKQASVYFESLLLGIIGIPLGLLLGLGLTVIALAAIRSAFQMVFSFEAVRLALKIHGNILLLCVLSGAASLIAASGAPGRAAGRVTVMETLRQTNIYHLEGKKMRHGKIMSLLFGIYGTLATKNIRRNPKRFRAITGSVFLAVVIGLSLYSLADFMTYQTSLDMRSDGSCYTDVEASVTYKDLPVAIKTLADQNISADVSWHLPRYMAAEFEPEQINPTMAGYFISGKTAELYVVGLDEEHFWELCEENGFDTTPYETANNHGILLNSATGNFGRYAGRIITGQPFQITSGTSIEFNNKDGENRSIIVQDIINGDKAASSRYVRDRAVLIVPLTWYDNVLNYDTYIQMFITTLQHKEAAECLTDAGFFQTFDVAGATENTRQIYLILKFAVCIFAVLMTMIITLNVCNTMSNTIYMRRSEFAVLRSIGMNQKGLKKMLFLEAVLYGTKALLLALPVSFLIHCVMYHLISSGMTPFAFYVKAGAYGIAVAAVCLVVLSAMLFSIQNVAKVEIVKELKMEST